jgi:hypothetical protein
MSPERRSPRLRLVAAGAGVARPAPHPGARDSDPEAGLIVAADVARALGAATVMRLRADPALTEYVCPFCDLPGRIRHPSYPAGADDQAAGAAAVLAIRYVNGMTVVRLAHPRCSPSAVLRLLRDARPVQHRVRAACWLRPTPAGGDTTRRGRMPVLLVDNQVRAWQRTRARGAEEYLPQALRALGFAPLTDLDAAAPVVPDLATVITPVGPRSHTPGTEAVVRVARRQAVVFDGLLDVPDAWADAARTGGRVVVVAGTALTDPRQVIGRPWPTDPDQLAAALTAAARAGRAWVGQAAVEPARDRRRGAPDQSTPVEPADPVQPETVNRRTQGIGASPDIPPPPNPAATTAQEATPRDSGKVTESRPVIALESSMWWTGWPARHSGELRWA